MKLVGRVIPCIIWLLVGIGTVGCPPAPPAPVTPPTTGPVVNQTLLIQLQNLEAANEVAAEVIQIAELSGALTGPDAVAANAAETAVTGALSAAATAVAAGDPAAPTLLAAAEGALSALNTHPAMVKARAAVQLVPKPTTAPK
jgi:hypothetical protein